jgi:oxygen-dependent protoporphyrinogen oxidase
MSRSCVVVGAGVAGLGAAYRLSNAGIKVTVLEADRALGGRAQTERVGDFIVNTGAGFVTTFYDATLEMLKELRLETVVPKAQLGMVATPFGKLPLDLGSPWRIVKFPLITFTGKLRALALIAQSMLRGRAHIGKPLTLARMDRGTTIETWGRSALGENAYEYLMRAGIEPFFYFGADQASSALAKVLMRHIRKWHMLALPTGTGALCDSLAERIEVRTGCHAHSVEESDGSVVVHHSGGKLEADFAVLAIPATAIAKLEGTISEEDRLDLSAVRYAANILLYFGYERPITVQYPLVTPAGPGRHAIARIRTMSEWVPGYVPEGKELISMHASSWRSAELLEEEPGIIVSSLRRDAEEIFGRLADPDWIRMYPRRQAVVLPEPMHYRRMRALLRRPRKRVLFAGDWLSGSTIEGALRTGLDAAQFILKK